jgi:hypothetical protein
VTFSQKLRRRKRKSNPGGVSHSHRNTDERMDDGGADLYGLRDIGETK